MSAPCFFEIPYDNGDTIKKFYGDLFGWEFHYCPKLDYTTIKTKTADGKEGIGGGMMQRQNENHKPTVYLDTDNIEAQIKKVEELGGKIIIPKSPVPTMGWMAWCTDPDGNMFALWQNDENAK